MRKDFLFEGWLDGSGKGLGKIFTADYFYLGQVLNELPDGKGTIEKDGPQ